MRLPRDFYARSPLEVGPELLNKVFVAGHCQGRIVEVEAYGGGNDPASHGYRGMTLRTEVMFGPPGHLYVYFTYGMHWCANVVCGDEGECSAVLLRALTPLMGIAEMRERRFKARRDRDLCSGPAKLAAAFGVDGSANGADLVRATEGISVLDDMIPPPSQPGCSARIGITRATDRLWRWYVPDCLDLSC
ncbi:MAG: DNA-3-methyladenine glycosylase [Acidimicrobiia bacterium]|nr:DNA-3-methyladenine glycosylase [Acidimicrobiia bacterium]